MASKAKRNYKLPEPRAVAEMKAKCFADPELFLPWEQTPKAVKQEFAKNGSIPCEGGGIPGEWCAGCRFGTLVTIDVEFKQARHK